MDVLTRPFDAERPAHGPLVPFRLGILAPFGGIGLLAVAAGHAGVLSLEVMRIVGVGSFHGGLLAASLAAAWEGAPGWGPAAAGLALSLLVAAGACAAMPWGCLGYVLPPIVLASVALRCGECRRMGLVAGTPWAALGLGVAVGGFLGAHLLLSASRTLGYPLRLGPPAGYLSALLYDVGANVLSAECFFRGTLFNRWQRRWGFWPGALAATGLSILRYLGDPALPGVVELTVGAVFYLALLSLSGCALLWYSGSLLPSLAAALAFFGAYRTLEVR
ncbi:MAG: hypothetical protein HYY64_01150 [Candidatus Rokubacteria bacterium]|nr:hypothetical protein [Candidatus Rokubacteria bacterium]